MAVLVKLIEFVFSIGLFINALLFVMQAVHIYGKKNAKGISLATFFGMLLIQLTVVLHGLIVADYILVAGYAASMVSCSLVVGLTIFYNRKSSYGLNMSEYEILNKLPCHIYWKNLQGDFLGCNRQQWEDLNFDSEEDFKGKSDYDLFPIDQAEEIRNNDARIIKLNQTDVVEERVTSCGVNKIYLSHKVPLRNDSNKVVGIIGVSVDVTSSSKFLREKINMLESIIGMMPGNVYWLDKEGSYLGCNDNQAKLLGLSSRKEIVGKKNSDLSKNSNFPVLPILQENNDKVLIEGLSLSAEEPAKLPGGSEIIYLSNKVPLYDSENNIYGALGISIDITERVQRETDLKIAKNKADISNKFKSDFISNMEHDIRTPFVGIYGMLKVLAKQENNKDNKLLIDDMIVCSKELMNYCDSVLDFSKVDCDEFSVFQDSLGLEEMAKSIVNIESIAAKHKNLSLSLDYDKNIPSVVIGDIYRMKRIFINLISNAIKFTDSGFIKFTVSMQRNLVEQRKVVVKFSVCDSGGGIPEDKRHLIYDPFTKLVSSNKGLYKGLGLGLHIVKQFVHDLGGDIQLKSEIGKGSTFVIFLPFKLPVAEETSPEYFAGGTA